MAVVVSVDVGGTGANSAAGARASLGVAAANDVVLKTGDTMTGNLNVAATLIVGNATISTNGNILGLTGVNGYIDASIDGALTTAGEIVSQSYIESTSTIIGYSGIDINEYTGLFWRNLPGGNYFGGMNYDQSNGLRIYTGGASPGNVRMTIANTGNVGIGTTSPSANLHVTGTIKDTPVVSITSSATYADNAAGRVIFSDTSSAITVTIAPAATAGFSYTIIRGNTGNVTIANSGVTRLNSAAITSMNVTQYGAATVVYTATNQVIVFGDFV